MSPGDWIWRQLGEPLSALLEGAAHLAPTVNQLLLQALFITVLSDEPSHSPSPAGFVSLRFFWTPAPFLFSSVWPYQPVAIAVLVYLLFAWGSAPPPLSGGACLTSVSVGSLSLSKHAGVGFATPAFSGRLTYLQFMWGSAPPPLPSRACISSASVGSLPLSKLSVGASTPAFFCRLVYLEFTWGSTPSPLLWSSGHPVLFATCPFFQLLIHYSVLVFGFFLLGGGTACHLLLTCGPAKWVRSWCLVAREPSWFLCIQ
jgi:hypothetical protein